MSKLHEVYHKTRDIVFCGKSKASIKMSWVISRYLKHIVYRKFDKQRLESIRHTNKKMKHELGAEIKHIFHITREECMY